MSRIEYAQTLIPGERVVDRELPRWRYRRVEAGGGDTHGLADVPGGHGGIEIGQGVEDRTLIAGEALKRCGAADGGQRKPERLVTKTWHMEMTATDALIPGQGRMALT